MKKSLLLHICCAPCSGFLADKLSGHYDVSVFFDNSNIYPLLEYEKRRNEAKKYFKAKNIEFIEAEYDHKSWLELIKGCEKDKEKGRRCLKCYEVRLANTAKYAEENGFDCFASTLAISPHKDAKVINEIGRKLADQYLLEFIDGDWKKEDGFKKAMALANKYDFYRQSYCGCEFSIRSG